MGFARLAKPAGRAAQPAPGRTLTTPRADADPTPRHDIGRVPISGPVQRRVAPGAESATAHGASNRTGLPDGLKAGLESLSGLSMDAVKVHYGSACPAQINALAYADGTDIHLAPGQDRHLPHEAWHVVQQAEGRVSPTIQLGGTAINDDTSLEREADRMGDASVAYGRSLGAAGPRAVAPVAGPAAVPASGVVQGVFNIKGGALKGTYATKSGRATKTLIENTHNAIGDDLAQGWKGTVADWADKAKGPYEFTDTADYFDFLLEHFGKVASDGKTRPNFSSIAYKLAKITYGVQTGVDQSALSPSDDDLAMPHRFPYASIELSVGLYISGAEDNVALERWTGRLYKATEERRDITAPKIADSNQRAYYKKHIVDQLAELRAAVAQLETAKAKGETLTLKTPVVQRMLKAANNMHGNIPDFGPHSDINVPVSNRLHVHVQRPSDWDSDDDDLEAPPTPGSYYALQMSPHRVPKGLAYDSGGDFLVGTDGRKIDPDWIQDDDDMIDQHHVGKTNIDASYLEDF